MNTMTLAVLKYKESNNEEDFLPIWKHFEPKIQYMANTKASQTPIDYDTFYEACVEGLLTAIRKFDSQRGEFSTYFYIWARGLMLDEVAKINRPKHQVNVLTSPLMTENADGEFMEVPLEDPSLNPEEQMIYDELEEVI